MSTAVVAEHTAVAEAPPRALDHQHGRHGVQLPLLAGGGAAIRAELAGLLGAVLGQLVVAPGRLHDDCGHLVHEAPPSLELLHVGSHTPRCLDPNGTPCRVSPGQPGRLRNSNFEGDVIGSIEIRQDSWELALPSV